MSLPRGIRNHNPGNIKAGNTWKGLTGRQDGPFDVFVDAAHGIRAAAKLLQSYQTAHGLNTIAGIIRRWAPPGENDTGAYIASVSIWSGFEADEPVDLYDYATALRVLRALIRFENGKPPEGKDYWYTPEVYERGLRMAGLTPGKALTQSRTMRGTAVAAGASSLAGTTVLINLLGLDPELAALLPTALDGIPEQAIAWIAILVSFGGSLYAAWARRDDKLRGRL